MNTSRLSRANRLVALRARELERTQHEFARCEAAVQEAVRQVQLAHALLQEQVGLLLTMSHAPVEEYDVLHSWCRVLDARRIQAIVARERACALQDAARANLVHASVELQKAQRFSDQVRAQMQQEELRRMQLVTDEHAARIARRAS